MESQTPKLMKKANRNIFHKVGKKLEKLEQSLANPSPSLSHKSASSLSDLSSSSYDERYLQQTDALSLQEHSKSSVEKRHHKHDGHLNRPHSSSSLNDIDPSTQWQNYPEKRVDPVIRKINTQHNKEMEEICKDLIHDKSVKLYQCRDYDKKVSLLQIAVSFNNPKVIIPVLLFLENTLSKPLFYELVKQHSSAIKTYINLGRPRLENESYLSMLRQFEKYEKVAMIRFQQANETNDINTKLSILDRVSTDISSHRWWHLQINEYQQLLRKQQELQRSFSSSQTNTRVENQTLMETYKMVFDKDFRQQKYNRNIDNMIIEKTKEIETNFRMSPEMIMCGKLSVIMQCGLRMHYEDFIHEAMHQGIFGKRYVIAPENLADMVYKWVLGSGEGQEKASESATRFLNMIQSPERRIYYAEKFQNYDVAIHTIANVLRDRVQFENFRKRIPRDHPAFNRATALLENTKWKN